MLPTPPWIKIVDVDLGLEAGQSSDGRQLVRRAVENMTRPGHHDKIENWIIRYFCDAFNRTHNPPFELVRRCQSSDCTAGDMPPDYIVATQDGSIIQFAEATEVFDPGRKRQQEYRETLGKVERDGLDAAVRILPDIPPSYESSLVEKAREVLEQKFGKRYPKGTWLVVYFNPQLPERNAENSHSFGVRVVQRALAQRALDQLAKPDRVEQMWILSNTLRIERVF